MGQNPPLPRDCHRIFLFSSSLAFKKSVKTQTKMWVARPVYEVGDYCYLYKHWPSGFLLTEPLCSVGHLMLWPHLKPPQQFSGSLDPTVLRRASHSPIWAARASCSCESQHTKLHLQLLFCALTIPTRL